MKNLERSNTRTETLQNVGSRAALLLALTGCAAAPQQSTEPAQPAARDKTNVAEIWVDDHDIGGPTKCEPLEWKVGESPSHPVMYRTEKGLFLSHDAGEYALMRWRVADADESGNYTAACPQPGLEGEALNDFVRITEDNRVVLKAAVNGGRQHRDEGFRGHEKGANFQSYVHEATKTPPRLIIRTSVSSLSTSHSNSGLSSKSSSTPLRSTTSSEPLQVESSGEQK